MLTMNADARPLMRRTHKTDNLEAKPKEPTMASWYDPKSHNGKTIYGAAALNARIKIAGGQDKLVADIASYALSRATRPDVAAEPEQKLTRRPASKMLARRRADFNY